MKHLLIIPLFFATCHKEPCPPPEPEMPCGTILWQGMHYPTQTCFVWVETSDGQRPRLYLPCDSFPNMEAGTWYCAPYWEWPEGVEPK